MLQTSPKAFLKAVILLPQALNIVKAAPFSLVWSCFNLQIYTPLRMNYSNLDQQQI